MTNAFMQQQLKDNKYALPSCHDLTAKVRVLSRDGAGGDIDWVDAGLAFGKWLRANCPLYFINALQAGLRSLIATKEDIRGDYSALPLADQPQQPQQPSPLSRWMKMPTVVDEIPFTGTPKTNMAATVLFALKARPDKTATVYFDVEYMPTSAELTALAVKLGIPIQTIHDSTTFAVDNAEDLERLANDISELIEKKKVANQTGPFLTVKEIQDLATELKFSWLLMPLDDAIRVDVPEDQRDSWNAVLTAARTRKAENTAALSPIEEISHDSNGTA